MNKCQFQNSYSPIATYISALILLLSAAASAVEQEESCTPRTRPPILIVDHDTLDFHQDKPTCVNKNGTFKIRVVFENGFTASEHDFIIRNKAKSGKIRLKSYNKKRQWLNVKVEDLSPETEYQYWIKVNGVGTIDPRVRVIDTPAAADDAKIRLKRVSEFLFDELGVELQALVDFDPTLHAETKCTIAEAMELQKDPTLEKFCEHAANLE